MKEHGKLTERQFAGIIANTMIGAGSLVLPRTAAEIAGTGAWISILTGGIISIIILLIILKLGLRFPEETIMEYAPRVLGKIPGKFFGLILCLYWLIITALVIRIFGSMLVSAVLIRTPIEIIIITMLLLVTYFIRHDLQVIGRVNEMYFIFIVLPIIVGIFLSMKEIEVIRLMPVLGTKGLLTSFQGGIMLFFSFLGFEVVTLLVPSITTQKLVFNYGLKGMLSPLVIYLSLAILALGVFGTEEILNLTWPTLELVKVTPFPGLILERLEVIFISFWVVAIFTTVANFYYSAVLGMSQILELEEHKTLIYPLLPLIYFIALIPDNIFMVFNYINYSSYLGAGLVIAIPGVIYTTAIFRKVKGDVRS